MRRILDPQTELIDGSEGTARQTRRLLERAGLLRQQGRGNLIIRTSTEAPEKLELYWKLLRAGSEGSGEDRHADQRSILYGTERTGPGAEG